MVNKIINKKNIELIIKNALKIIGVFISLYLSSSDAFPKNNKFINGKLKKLKISVSKDKNLNGIDIKINQKNERIV
ncbi:hypothetical protein NX772_02290 [Mesomycoplasma molare]|uniref:Uncharacterized protein n=1 Tax=Mesomycoplasma molare TaxID=171288 RepID=A0ABY5TTC5_9BACT|nr:hypothetical protein [Mesomycoplasma molare]UWD33918.1 hypothetical protein NX772_02290 [Mesomycoplasma molare]